MLTRMFLIAALCLVPLFGKARTLQGLDQYATHATVAGIADDRGVQSELRQLLGPDYEGFTRNFQHWAAPAKLRDGGLFVEGWQKGEHHKKTSVFIVYSDGRIHAAWMRADDGVLRYYTNARNDAHELPPALKVWSRILGRPISTLYMSARQNPDPAVSR